MLVMLKSLRKRLKKKKKITNDVNSLSIITKNNMLLNASSSLTKKKVKNLSLIKKEINSLSSTIIKINNISRKQKKLYTNINFELTIDDLIYYIKSETRRICISLLLKKKNFN